MAVALDRPCTYRGEVAMEEEAAGPRLRYDASSSSSRALYDCVVGQRGAGKGGNEHRRANGPLYTGRAIRPTDMNSDVENQL